MPTIQIGGNPSAYGDIGRAEFDDVHPTQVEASVTVTNTGNAIGRVKLRIGTLERGPDGEPIMGSVLADRGFLDVDNDPNEGNWRDLDVRYNLAKDAYMDLVVDVIDDRGNILAQRVTSVNAYDIPQIPRLASGAIFITVT